MYMTSFKIQKDNQSDYFKLVKFQIYQNVSLYVRQQHCSIPYQCCIYVFVILWGKKMFEGTDLCRFNTLTKL